MIMRARVIASRSGDSGSWKCCSSSFCCCCRGSLELTQSHCCKAIDGNSCSISRDGQKIGSDGCGDSVTGPSSAIVIRHRTGVFKVGSLFWLLAEYSTIWIFFTKMVDEPSSPLARLKRSDTDLLLARWFSRGLFEIITGSARSSSWQAKHQTPVDL